MFLLRPRPFPDESISSWRQRIGFANGFWRFPLPSGRRTLADPDRLPNQEEQEWLSEQCLIDKQVMAELSLEAKLGRIQSKDVFSPHLRWALPIGEKRKQAVSGPMFCPECIREDEKPYFRIHWRYAFLTECPVHRKKLLDKCPECANLLWPSTLRLITREKPWLDISSCPICSFDLKSSVLQVPEIGIATTNPIWVMLSTGVVAPEFPHIKSLPEFFDGLWAFCQLLLRKSGQVMSEFLSEHPPPVTPGMYAIESIDVSNRSSIVANAYWLMEDWPQRFLEAGEKVGITKFTFAPTAAVNPPWLVETLDEYLGRHNKIILTTDVTSAIDNLRSSGAIVTKRAVKRLLGIRESTVLDAAMFRRNIADVSELMCLIQKFEQEIAVSKNCRGQKAALLRDYLIFILSVMNQTPIENICTMSGIEVEQLISAENNTDINNFELIKSLKERALGLNALYGNEVRPHFQKITSVASHWFITREGKAFAGHTLRERISKLMRRGFSENLWRSCDVFIFTLKSEPTSSSASA